MARDPARNCRSSTWAIDLPAGPELLQEYCASLLDSAAGDSLLVSAIEEMPATAQDAMIDLLGELGSARVPSTARLISGTTVSLLDRSPPARSLSNCSID